MERRGVQEETPTSVENDEIAKRQLLDRKWQCRIASGALQGRTREAFDKIARANCWYARPRSAQCARIVAWAADVKIEPPDGWHKRSTRTHSVGWWQAGSSLTNGAEWNSDSAHGRRQMRCSCFLRDSNDLRGTRPCNHGSSGPASPQISRLCKAQESRCRVDTHARACRARTPPPT